MGFLVFSAEAGGAAWIGYLVARRLLPGASTSARAAGAAIAAFGFLYVLLHALLLAHAFSLPFALPAVAVAGAAAHFGLDGRNGLVAARQDARRAVELLRAVVCGPGAALVAAVVLVVGSRLVRALVLPPLGWDALVYHLFKAGRWVQLGHDFFQEAPVPWGHYEYMPSGGSCLWAWALLASRDGATLAPAAALIWITILLAGYAAARRFGASQSAALCCGAVLGTTPAVAASMTASYVDNTTLLACTLAFVFAGASRDASARSEPGETLFLAMGLALAAATKTTFLPVLVLAGALVVFRLLFSHASLRRRAWAFASFAVPALCVVAIEYGRGIRLHGNPVYPFALSFAGFQLAPAAPGAPVGTDLAASLGGYSWSEPLRWLFLPVRWPRSDYAGLGLGALAATVLAAVGAVRVGRDRELRRRFIVPALVVAVVAAAASSPEAVALRTLFASVFARHLIPAYAAILLPAAILTARSAWPLWFLIVISNAWFCLPRGWGAADVVAVGAIAPVAAVGLVAAVFVVSIPPLSRKSGPVRAIAALVVVAASVAVGVPGIRAAYRYPIWNSALEATEGAYDFHSLDDPALAAWPIWQHLDDGEGHRIAVVSLWGQGATYLFPLMGSRLQNFVTYVSPTLGGGIVDYRDLTELQRTVQLRAWLRRLVDERIDRVVSLRPSPPERLEWIVKLPELFVPEAEISASDNWLYRFDRASAERLLASP